jgi:hypothetical protein
MRLKEREPFLQRKQNRYELSPLFDEILLFAPPLFFFS